MSWREGKRGEEQARGCTCPLCGTHLAIIKSPIHGDTVNILIRHSCHLSFLDWRDTTVWVEDEDGDVLFTTKTVDGGAVW